jgi:hypothetical protein
MEAGSAKTPGAPDSPKFSVFGDGIFDGSGPLVPVTATVLDMPCDGGATSLAEASRGTTGRTEAPQQPTIDRRS